MKGIKNEKPPDLTTSSGSAFSRRKSKADQVAARNLAQDEWKRFLGDRPYRPISFYESLKEADRSALDGDVEQARKSFKQVVDLAVKTGDAAVNNEVAWYGS